MSKGITFADSNPETGEEFCWLDELRGGIDPDLYDITLCPYTTDDDYE